MGNYVPSSYFPSKIGLKVGINMKNDFLETVLIFIKPVDLVHVK